MTNVPARSGLRLRRAPFADLTPYEVYGLCRLRVDVFVVEQECPYPELDGRDTEATTQHLWFEADDGGILATIRVLDDGPTSVENGALLCESHHTKVHHGFRIERQPDGRWRTWRPDGTEILLHPHLLTA